MLIINEADIIESKLNESETLLQEFKALSIKHMVAYTDGGARPNPGNAGYGVHSYLFNDEKPKVGAGARATPTKVGYKDGKVEGAVNILGYIDSWGVVGQSHSNNMGELMGLVCAFKTAVELNVNSLVIHTDSTYVKEGITKWCKGWVKNGWIKKDGQAVLNQEYWKELLELRDVLVERKVKIEYHWVKGHAGNLGNTMADNLASKAVIVAKSGSKDQITTASKARGYWSDTNEYNYLFSKAFWYCNTNITLEQSRSEDGRYIYYTGRHNDGDVFLGKKTPDASYCVILAKEPEPVLESIRSKLNKLAEEAGNTAKEVVVGELRTTTRAKLYNEIEANGGKFLYMTKDGLNLKNYDETVLARIKRPARMALFAFDYLVLLEATLESYFQKDKLVTITDITADIYDAPVGKSKKITLKKTHSVGSKSFTVKAKVGDVEHDIKLLFDIDLPERNALARLANSNPKISVVTWMDGDKAYRYACVVEAGEDASIWSSVHSNLILL